MYLSTVTFVALVMLPVMGAILAVLIEEDFRVRWTPFMLKVPADTVKESFIESAPVRVTPALLLIIRPESTLPENVAPLITWAVVPFNLIDPEEALIVPSFVIVPARPSTAPLTVKAALVVVPESSTRLLTDAVPEVRDG
jgi:hypothetical protein